MDRKHYQRRLREARDMSPTKRMPQYGDFFNPWLEERNESRRKRREYARIHSLKNW